METVDLSTLAERMQASNAVSRAELMHHMRGQVIELSHVIDTVFRGVFSDDYYRQLKISHGNYDFFSKDAQPEWMKKKACQDDMIGVIRSMSNFTTVHEDVDKLNGLIEQARTMGISFRRVENESWNGKNAWDQFCVLRDELLHKFEQFQSLSDAFAYPQSQDAVRRPQVPVTPSYPCNSVQIDVNSGHELLTLMAPFAFKDRREPFTEYFERRRQDELVCAIDIIRSNFNSTIYIECNQYFSHRIFGELQCISKGKYSITSHGGGRIDFTLGDNGSFIEVEINGRFSETIKPPRIYQSPRSSYAVPSSSTPSAAVVAEESLSEELGGGTEPNRFKLAAERNGLESISDDIERVAEAFRILGFHHKMQDKVSNYDKLQYLLNYTPADIEKRVRVLSLLYHPDKHKDDTYKAQVFTLIGQAKREIAVYRDRIFLMHSGSGS